MEPPTPPSSRAAPKPHAETHALQAATAEAIDRLLPGLGGEDSRGTKFASVAAVWRCKAPLRAARPWYALGAAYWATIRPDLDGVLGGQTHISGADEAESEAFLLQRVLGARGAGRARCLDLGAGIGRVTKQLLGRLFDVCDLVEQDPDMLAQAKLELQACLPPGRLGRCVVAGLQELSFADHLALPAKGSARGSALGAGGAVRYDVIWLQWVVGCVLDCDFVRLLSDAAAHLAPRGCIVVKDNCAKAGTAFVYDCTDSSIARGLEYHEAVFALAGLEVVERVTQQQWDSELMAVHMWMLRPSGAGAATAARMGAWGGGSGGAGAGDAVR